MRKHIATVEKKNVLPRRILRQNQAKGAVEDDTKDTIWKNKIMPIVH